MEVELIKRFYEEVYQKAGNCPGYELKLSERNLKFLNNFIKNFSKKYPNFGAKILWDFTIFQFEYYSTIKTEQTLQLNWIYGEKAIARWINKRADYSFWCRNF